MFKLGKFCPSPPPTPPPPSRPPKFLLPAFLPFEILGKTAGAIGAQEIFLGIQNAVRLFFHPVCVHSKCLEFYSKEYSKMHRPVLMQMGIMKSLRDTSGKDTNCLSIINRLSTASIED